MLLTQDVVKAMAEITKGTQKEAKLHLDALKEVITTALKNGEDVALKGLVSFENKEVAEGKAKNPKTREEVIVPAHRKASAKLAKSLRKF
ncbi:TPA: HU family DNA-binding protein [Bacillus cereus]|uniref:HU family DNA-binding protein n=1 Tax=Bacillus paranthracis TaxID=2026186 RepID=UPI002D787444|nr:HU family DNA-binding protein [Bacillus paranthracis]HDR8454014.1 HU family DNA-binding protein [Bacillus cereus]